MVETESMLVRDGGRANFSLYDNPMPVKVTDKQLDVWVAEAEHGYDPQELKKRGRGRPGRGSEPAEVVAVRLTQEELTTLDRVAAKEKISRSELIRRAIKKTVFA
ncbi:Ribbon-helix-helix protein, copG family [Corynebacterium minutissimum]|uniref:Ribbon-helix-helix protein, copG family n=2 Tax=Corynebacterium minutissimum TaxID=38301 RepID=A0A376CQK5_9CORY|nr:Ribbon-helix-helix protein, copG family [Corynebacterium minutissimum]